MAETDATTAAWSDMVLVGTIARAHGIRGQMVVNGETDFPEARFSPGAELFVRREGRVEAARITSCRMQRGRPIIGLAGVVTMTEAEQWVGCELRVPAASLEALAPGAFYRHDLVGCVVSSVAGERIGIVRAVEGPSAGSRLVVDGQAGDVLIPMAASICVAIDIEARTIVVDPPDGLLELNRTRRGRTPGGA